MSSEYSIIITCNAEGMNVARAIKQQLELNNVRGNVFFEYGSMDVQRTLSVIDRAKIFICILTRDSMMGCASPSDRLRREIIQARNRKLKMIFINPNGEFRNEFPEGFPEELDFVRKTHQITIHMDSSFERDIAGMKETEIEPVLRHGLSGDVVGYISLTLVIVSLIVGFNYAWWAGVLLFFGASYLMSKLHIL